MYRTLLGKATLGALGVAGAGGAYAYNDEGTRRSILFWGQAFPIYAHYRVNEWMVKGKTPTDQDSSYDVLHEQYAPFVYNLTLNLRGFYLKLAQVVSVREEIIPPQYSKFLKTLQDRVPAEFTQDQVREMVAKHLGKPINEVFSEFDDKPLGAASIGQVHKAKLLDGRDVVVKLQFPKAEKLFKTDIQTIKNFCKLAMPFHVPALREIEKQFMTEFDYRQEADNMALVADNVNQSEWNKRVVVPKPISELCTKDMLVMEYLPGVKMADGIREQFSRIAEKQGKTLEQLEEEQKAKIKKGEVVAGPSSFQLKAYSAYLQTKDFVSNVPRFAYNWAICKPLRLNTVQYVHTEIPINIPEIMDVLLKVHGYEIFTNGAFNGDPHPGNVLLMPDGRLGLIDYGQLKKMDLKDRLIYAKFIIALADNNKPEIVRIFTEDMKIATKHMNPVVLEKMARFWHDYDNNEVRNGLNVQLFMEWMNELDPPTELPDEWVMPSRVSVLLRGVGSAFQLELSTAKAWKPYAQQLLDNYAKNPKLLEA